MKQLGEGAQVTSTSTGLPDGNLSHPWCLLSLTAVMADSAEWPPSCRRGGGEMGGVTGRGGELGGVRGAGEREGVSTAGEMSMGEGEEVTATDGSAAK